MANDQKGDTSAMAGWAAILTAIAALVTAFGFPQIIPGLFEKATQEPSIPNTESVPSLPKKETSQNEASETLLADEESPVEAFLSLRQHMSYLKAREIMFSAGWEPVDRRLAVSEEASVLSEESPSIARFGIDLEEINSCQGTGLGLCSGTLELVDGRSVDVTVAQGMNEPILVSWTSNFYVEPPQDALKAVEQLKVGLPYEKITVNLVAAGWRVPVINPMHMSGVFPAVEHDFKMQFPNFEECHVENEEVKTCKFPLFLGDDRKLTITTGVNKLNQSDESSYSNSQKSIYELTVQDWILE